MDALLDTITLARKELDTNGKKDTQLSEESYVPQEVSIQKRRLLDIAWKMYDITSEMFYLKSDVAALASKVESIEVSSGTDGNRHGKGFGIESHKDTIANGESKGFHRWGLFYSGDETRKAKSKEDYHLGMDDLSFSIFKEIVSEIATECVGKSKATDSKMEDQKLPDHRGIRKNRFNGLERDRDRNRERDREGDRERVRERVKESGRERDNRGSDREGDVREYKNQSSYDWDHSHKRNKYFEKDAKHRPGSLQYDRERVKDLRNMLKHRSSGLDTRIADFARRHSDEVVEEKGPVAKKQVSFRRHNSNIDDWPDHEDGLLAKLNDSLYFHRSHLSPVQKSQYKSKRESNFIRISPTFSSDGSDIL